MEKVHEEAGAGSKHHVVVIYTEAGGGHKAAAEALREVLEATGDYRVSLVNPYREVHPELDVFARWTRYDGEAVYNELIIGQGRTGLFCLAYYLVVMLSIRLQYRTGRRALHRHLEQCRPDLVVSVLPLLNDVILDSLPARCGGEGTVPFAVLMTDWVEMSRHVWFPKRPRYYAICGTEPGYAQMAARPALTGRVFRTSGLLIRPAFLDVALKDRTAERRALGLEPDKPVVCMLYGGGGSWRMRELGQELAERPADVQVVFLCGRNEPLASALRAIEWPFPVQVHGFTPEVHRFLGVADVFVGKPGPGSVSEALAVGPALLLDRRMVLPQERPLLRWVEREGLGRGFSSAADFRRALETALHTTGGTVAAPARRENRAARELPAIVAEILQREGGGRAG
ncbi:MAG: hypothetical protein ACQETD_08190 [Pseudomonadota bacterium]